MNPILRPTRDCRPGSIPKREPEFGNELNVAIDTRPRLRRSVARLQVAPTACATSVFIGKGRGERRVAPDLLQEFWPSHADLGPCLSVDFQQEDIANIATTPSKVRLEAPN
jgi:hypothetical protein